MKVIQQGTPARLSQEVNTMPEERMDPGQAKRKKPPSVSWGAFLDF